MWSVTLKITNCMLLLCILFALKLITFLTLNTDIDQWNKVTQVLGTPGVEFFKYLNTSVWTSSCDLTDDITCNRLECTVRTTLVIPPRQWLTCFQTNISPRGILMIVWEVSVYMWSRVLSLRYKRQYSYWTGNFCSDMTKNICILGRHSIPYLAEFNTTFEGCSAPCNVCCLFIDSWPSS